MAYLPRSRYAKGKGHSAGSQPYSAGSQPYSEGSHCDANGVFWLEGVALPPWWPKDNLGYPIHKVYRAMNEGYNELWAVPNRPPDYPHGALTEMQEKLRCLDALAAIDTGSKGTSPFLHCSTTEAGARSYLSQPDKLFCKVNLLTLFQKGIFHQNSFIDLSNEKAWNACIDKARMVTATKTISHRRNYDEFLLCWRGEVPLEIFEVFTPPPPLKIQITPP